MKRAAIVVLVVLAMAAARTADAQSPLPPYVEARQKFELAGHATGPQRGEEDEPTSRGGGLPRRDARARGG
jgi:hypothetical protein